MTKWGGSIRCCRGNSTLLINKTGEDEEGLNAGTILHEQFLG